MALHIKYATAARGKDHKAPGNGCHSGAAVATTKAAIAAVRKNLRAGNVRQLQHAAWGKRCKHSQIWRASNHFNANKAQQMALRLPCKLTHDWPRGGGMPQNWQRQRGPKMDACGSLSGTRKMLPGLCMPTGHHLPATPAWLWSLVACSPPPLSQCRLPPFVCAAVVDACNWNFCRIYQSATGALAACGKAMCCR